MDGREQPRPQPSPRVSSPQQHGVMMGPGHVTFGPAPQNNSATSAAMTSSAMMHGRGMPLTFNQMVSSSAMKPTDLSGSMYSGDGGAAPGMRPSSGSGMLAASDQEKKKRGRPRKYAPDGPMRLALAPMSSSPPAGHSAGGPPANPEAKRKGRPPGSGKKRQLEALGFPGTSFTPHVITVKPNEDVASKIMAFSQQGPRTTCIMTASGALSTVTLRQPATSGGIVTYEGRFDILSLSGSFLLAEDGDTRSRTGGLSVALVGTDGRVIGGCVAGMLMAATPVQVVMGSFIVGGKKPKGEQPKREPSTAPPHMSGIGAASTASPTSDGTSSEHSDDPGSPDDRNDSTFNNSGHHFQSAYGWPLSGNQSRYDPDLNMMAD